METPLPPNPNPNPNPNQLEAPPPPQPSSPPPSFPNIARISSFAAAAVPRRPAIRLTSEFDSDSSLFFHKVSFRLFDRLAKLKLSFQNDRNGDVSSPHLGFLTRYFSVLYDVESRNALLNGSLDVSPSLQLKATHDVKNDQIGKPEYIHIGWSTSSLSMSCTSKNDKSIVYCLCFGRVLQFKYHREKEQQGEVAMIASLAPSYKLELSSAVPTLGLPRATLRFPLGEVSVAEREDEELKRVLSINGILKGQLMNGVCTALYKDNDLNLRYSYKDGELTFIPSVSLPANALSFAFKRRFSPADKLSYWYHFDTSAWSTVYKRTVGKDLKFKAGYDSEVRLGWASLWVGDEDGKAKTAPMKMKVQFMLQVPQDDVRSSAVMFRVKKRWDI
ncbi:outer envelope pore protein 37, chloroplastic isoform X2 [Iris pallida]|uniref:Outer envelope pore protein 37, chloroplastic isoform X2 n=1 Tax=Iris pallida TaxID=29817 RepID=A0AAX6FN53_IRIPA|nr:outer envelope pore protein 37, chloroplastic isoform X2 [Iris pallida]